MIKVVVADLDGTLLDASHRVSNFTQEVVRKLRNQGKIFIIATGRHRQDISPMVRHVGSRIFTITSNGASIHDTEGKLFHRENIKAVVVRKILALTNDYSVHRNVYCGDHWYAEADNKRLLALHEESGFYYQLADFSAINHSTVPKIFFLADNRNRAELLEIESVLRQHCGHDINLTFSLDHALEVMAKGVSKAQALQRVLDHQAHKPEETMGFGDGMNDLEMLQLVGHPVLMANAHANLKRSIEQYQLAQANSDDGVAHFLKAYFW